MEKYKGVNFGKLKIPYYSLFEDVNNPYSKEDVQINVNPKLFIIPDKEVQKFHEETIRKKEEESKKTGKIFFDGPLVKLNDYRVNDDSHSLELYVQRTSFFTYASTNKSLNEDLVWKMVERRSKSYTNLDDGLANPIGCNTLSVTSDGYVALNKRSEKVAVYPKFYGILPAGFCNPEKDNYNPFNTVEREAKEELGIKIREPKLLGFGRAGDDRHIEFLFLSETPYKKLEVLSAPKSSKYEAEEMIFVEFEPRKLAPYIATTIDKIPKDAIKRNNLWILRESPSWVPAHVYLLILALISEYGFDQTYRAIEKCVK
jgi:ADP-ribose pyrophosphatase YjhB (NUDIX family)